MQKVNLETVYKFLEDPDSFTDEESSKVCEYLIALKEKLKYMNSKYNLNLNMSDYITSVIEKYYSTVVNISASG